MKISFRCQNCDREITCAATGDVYTLSCPYCSYNNELKKISVVCPNCRKETESYIPKNNQVWGVHYADRINIKGSKPNIATSDKEHTTSFSNGGEVESKCNFCDTSLHIQFMKGEFVGGLLNPLEKFVEYFQRRLGKPQHVFGLIPDKTFRSISAFVIVFLFVVSLGLLSAALHILFNTKAISLQPISSFTGSLSSGLLMCFSYAYLKKIKEVASEIEGKLYENKKDNFYNALDFIFKPSLLIVYTVIIFSILSVDNFSGNNLQVRWLTEIACIPNYVWQAMILQIFVGYGIVLYAIGGGAQFSPAIEENFMKVRPILKKLSSINFMIAFTISVFSTFGVFSIFYFAPSSYIETYSINGLLLLFLPLLIITILSTFLVYSLLLQNLTNKIKERTLRAIDEKISAIIDGQEKIDGKKELIPSYFSIKNYVENSDTGIMSYGTMVQALSIFIATALPYLVGLLRAAQ